MIPLLSTLWRSLFDPMPSRAFRSPVFKRLRTSIDDMSDMEIPGYHGPHIIALAKDSGPVSIKTIHGTLIPVPRDGSLAIEQDERGAITGAQLTDNDFSERERSMLAEMRKHNARLPWCDESLPLVERIELLLTDRGAQTDAQIQAALGAVKEDYANIIFDDSWGAKEHARRFDGEWDQSQMIGHRFINMPALALRLLVP